MPPRLALAGRFHERLQPFAPSPETPQKLRIGLGAPEQPRESLRIADGKVSRIIRPEDSNRAGDSGSERRNRAGNRLAERVGPALHLRAEHMQAAAGKQAKGLPSRHLTQPTVAGI